MQLTTVRIDKPEAINFILGQTHFIKTVEDAHEALVNAVPGIKFGLAFCEASGKCLVRWSGTDATMIELARKNALAIAAGPCSIESRVPFLDHPLVEFAASVPQHMKLRNGAAVQINNAVQPDNNPAPTPPNT